MVKENAPMVRRSSSSEIDKFLGRAARTPALSDVKGRLIFAVDATMSRQPTWDRATEIQSDMFEVAQSIGALGVQLVYFRGRGEFEVSPWTTTPAQLAAHMRDVTCRSGFTQLRCVLMHAAEEARRTRVGALVYIGDCFEENPDAVAKAAGVLALTGVPAFMFHEGNDAVASATFREVARLTRGIYARFDQGAARQLRELLRAAAAYATGGSIGLRELGGRVGGETARLALLLADRR